MFRYLIALLVVFTMAHADSGNGSLPTNRTVMSLIQLYNLSNDTLRAGFEAFYFITNGFVDNLLKPNLPRELLQSSNESESLPKTVIRKLELDQNIWRSIGVIFKSYPSLFCLIIGCVLIGLLIKIAGLVVCCYRCCCRPKFNPFDEKFDSMKRKANSFVLFILLIVNLLGTIILFFTNQNSMIALTNTPKLINASSDQINAYFTSEVPIFFEKLSGQVLPFKQEASQLFDSTIEISLNSSLKNLNLTELINFYDDEISNELETIRNTKPNLTALFDEIDWKKAGLNEDSLKSLRKQIENIDRDVKSQFGFLDDVKSTDLKFENLVTEMNANIKSFKLKFLQKVDETINEKSEKLNQTNKMLAEFVHEKLKNLNNGTIIRTVNSASSYYKYVYYFLLGVSIFMLTLFLLFSMGLVGMCARRIHNNYKQMCHRGISANFLLSGVGLYFLFSLVLMLIIVVLFVPGVFMRHFVCKPGMELENNHLFLSVKNIPDVKEIIGEININKLLLECDQTNRSSEINRIINKKIEMFINESTPFILSKLNEEISKINASSMQDSINNMHSLLKRASGSLTDLNANKKDILKNLNDLNGTVLLLDSIINNQTALHIQTELKNISSFIEEITNPKNQENLNKLIDMLTAVQRQLNQNSNINEMFQQSINKTLNDFVTQKLNQLSVKKSDEIANILPSCRIVSGIYSSVVLSGCFEFLDNFNTFWFTLLILFIIYLLVVIFSLSQADLFRKYYAFDEISAEEVITEDKDSYGFRSENFSDRDSRGASRYQNNNWPIDAYEMSKQNQADNAEGFRYPSSHSPQSQYRMTRA